MGTAAGTVLQAAVGLMVIAEQAADGRRAGDVARVQPCALPMMDRLGNVATPLTADTVVVPDSVPPPGLAPMATVMLAVELVTVLPNASCTVTCTGGAIATPAVAFAGCTEKATRVAAAGVMLNAPEVAPVSGADAAVNVPPRPSS